MISWYGQNDDLNEARGLLDTMTEKLGLAWGSLDMCIVVFSRMPRTLFIEMRLIGVHHYDFTYTSVISACANGDIFSTGKRFEAF